MTAVPAVLTLAADNCRQDVAFPVPIITLGALRYIDCRKEPACISIVEFEPPMLNCPGAQATRLAPHVPAGTVLLVVIIPPSPIRVRFPLSVLTLMKGSSGTSCYAVTDLEQLRRFIVHQLAIGRDIRRKISRGIGVGEYGSWKVAVVIVNRRLVGFRRDELCWGNRRRRGQCVGLLSGQTMPLCPPPTLLPFPPTFMVFSFLRLFS